MIGFACLERVVSRSGEARYRLGHPLVDRYLEFVAGRARPNTLQAVAFDLKVFFTVVAKDPVTVAPVDVSEFLAHQRGDRTVVRLADRESGLSARTSRLSSVSGLYGYLIARGDTPVRVSPVPRGLPARRHGGAARSRWCGFRVRCAGGEGRPGLATSAAQLLDNDDDFAFGSPSPRYRSAAGTSLSGVAAIDNRGDLPRSADPGDGRQVLHTHPHRQEPYLRALGSSDQRPSQQDQRH